MIGDIWGAESGPQPPLEDMIVQTEFTDKDYDIITQYIIDKKLGLVSVDELSCNQS